ncbi:MAG: protein kinase [Gammaproteobacteria bacterium]|nr:protein kinase [Gammaproteobacteria bacterium]MDH5803064.1 protein kinase [Gammaproteobacteria bacterium]
MSENGARDTLPQGHVLHWYEIDSILGRGGYGVTYLATDKNLHRQVAIKEYLPTDFACRENNHTVHPMTDGHRELYTWGLERFLSEARTLARFNHRAIIKVLSVFEQNNTAYMVMEYEEGDDLSVVFDRDAKFTQAQILNMFLPILEGLSFVHESGFIHRDIKPSNIYIRNDGSTVLLDFGSARQTLESHTRALTTLVTAGYAPYEQYNQSEDEQGAWTDIYALGSTLYYFLTNNKPADALLRGSSLLRQGKDIYEPVSRMNLEGYSPAFLRAVDHALMFHAEKRPHTVKYWADMLQEKVDVPDITDDLYNLNYQPDPDLESTAVMKPVTAAEMSAANPNAPTPQVVTTPLIPEDEDEHTRIHVQPVSMDQLDKMTEALSRPPEPVAAVQAPLQGVRSTPPKASGVSEFLEGLLVSIKGLAGRVDNRVALIAAAAVGSFALVSLIIVLVTSVDDSTVSPVVENSETKVQTAQLASEPPKQEEDLTQNPISAEGSVENPEAVIDSTAEPDSAQRMPKTAEQTLVTSNGHILSKADRDLMVINLLKLAASDKRQNRIISPESNNAFERYEQILELDPGHPTALQEIANIRDIYIDRVGTAVEQEQWDVAQKEFPILKRLSVDLQTIGIIETKLQDHKEKVDRIAEFLATADKMFKQKKLTRPADYSALAYYEKVLILDSENAEAKQGIQNIIDYLAGVLQRQLKERRIDAASRTYNSIAEIDPDAPVLNQAGSSLSKLVEKNKKIRNLLTRAKKDFIQGRVIAPKGNNALAKYRAVLSLDKKNKRALTGVNTIYQYYLVDINNGIDTGRFDKAEKLIKTLAGSGYDKKKIAALNQRLNAERLATSKEPETVNQLLTDLVLDLKNKNLKGIYQISVLSEKKKNYLKKVFENYSEYSVKIKESKHNTQQHKASATIQLADIVDIWGDRLGSKQVKFDVQLSRNKDRKWKIYWQNNPAK